MNKPERTPPRDSEAGPESMLPGERSGEGSEDLFKHVQRDLRRKSTLGGPQRPRETKS